MGSYQAIKFSCYRNLWCKNIWTVALDALDDFRRNNNIFRIQQTFAVIWEHFLRHCCYELTLFLITNRQIRRYNPGQSKIHFLRQVLSFIVRRESKEQNTLGGYIVPNLSIQSPTTSSSILHFLNIKKRIMSFNMEVAQQAFGPPTLHCFIRFMKVNSP